ncbi:MAG: DEAD/DEAH box helicase family protein [Patescibacteria group bacterium]|nr:DEAD/DEAH box helicase family protein [Patescibacteria group bacterium]
MVFQSPTGSGKTIMMQRYLRQFSDAHTTGYAFIWMSVNDLSRQSKRSFEKNLEGSRLRFSELADIQDKQLKDNEILFINWESLRAKYKGTDDWKNIAMRDNEREENIPTYMHNTHKQGRKIILIVDESHRSLDSKRAQELIVDYIKPDLQIEVSATPDSPDFDEIVKVDIQDVIESGMVKKEVLINPDFSQYQGESIATDRLVIEQALAKQQQLKDLYAKQGSDVKPLVLIQLPSEKKKVEDIDKTKMERTIQILQEKGVTVDNQKLAIWLSEDKTNKDLIGHPESPVEVLLFKQAIAIGWDCPRAQILVMFHDMKSESFKIQTVGRILRMPEWKHYPEEELNKAFVYTDLEQAKISIDAMAKNVIKSRIATRDPELYTPISLPSIFKSRTDYKDIGLSFYNVFAKTLVETI